MVPMPAREVYFEGAMKRVVRLEYSLRVLPSSTFAVIAEVFLCLLVFLQQQMFRPCSEMSSLEFNE